MAVAGAHLQYKDSSASSFLGGQAAERAGLRLPQALGSAERAMAPRGSSCPSSDPSLATQSVV